MRGTVVFWKREYRDPTEDFSWGFIMPEGSNRRDANVRVYFNSKSARYSPVKQGDLVEYEIKVFREPRPDRPGSAASKVERVEQ
ncbi:MULTISPECIES: hypothetical protein [Bradyrhizobium]|uniref:CSD domain-containing protein n=2 Tax=Bradyrhizobium TaxID=374 RepID=A0ABY0PJR0_9BRAD|nr:MULTISPECIES: hypothetical protein [Bradyrhizobium]SDI54416.1 hypothetical protein SAMN05444163_3085 [Bradyrhizobium ottawaense]SED43054.1 hypothetical protein SAMN05444171_4084 [Bradyrhizobium lablabi]